MKTGLTTREKVLVGIAIAMAVSFASARYVIIPLYDQYTARTAEYETLSSEKALLDATLLSEPDIRLNYEKAKESFLELTKLYPTLMPNEEVDRILTGLCKVNDLNPVSLDMSEPTPFTPPKEEGAEQDTEAEASSEEEAAAGPPLGAFYVVSANMSLNGGYEDLMNLVDTIKDISYIRLSQVSHMVRAPRGQPGAGNIEVVFEVTMLGVEA